MTRGRLWSALIALTVVASCSAWRPPPPDPLEGWRDAPPGTEGVEEKIRGTSALQILPVVAASPNDYAGHFDNSETTRKHLATELSAGAVFGVEVGSVRRHEDISWVDVTFERRRARRRGRIAWFAAEGGSRVFRLVTPAADWNARDLTSFMGFVRHRLQQARLSE